MGEPPNWGYKPPPPPSSVITEQPTKAHAFAPSHAYYQNAGTLESLAEKVHAFYPGQPGGPPVGPSRRMSTGTGNVGLAQQHARFPRSGSDQHLPRVEYSDYSNSLGRHSLLRSSLKPGTTGGAPMQVGVGGTLGRYGRYDQQRAGVSKYGPPSGGAQSLTRRSRPNLDYSSDTEATIGPRPSYYYYNRPAIGSMSRGSGGAGGGVGAASTAALLAGAADLNKFNSLPRERPGTRLQGIRSRMGDRLVDENDGNTSAPEFDVRRGRDLRQRITASPSIFTADEYRAWLRRAPSSSAIAEQMRMTRDMFAQPRAQRFSCSAENIHDALRNVSIYIADESPNLLDNVILNSFRRKASTPVETIFLVRALSIGTWVLPDQFQHYPCAPCPHSTLEERVPFVRLAYGACDSYWSFPLVPPVRAAVS